MKKKQPSAFLSDIFAHVSAAPSHWFYRVPEEAKAEVRTARDGYRDGTLAGKPHRIASGIIAAAERRGWKLPQEKAVVVWLKRND
jgi:hypothetical protein